MIKLIIFFIPFFLGVWGFLLEGEPLLDAFFYSINLYLLNYTYHPANLCIELARWLAPLVTASGILLAIATLRDRLVHFILYLTGKSIVVYGSDETKEKLLREIGKYGINGQDRFIRASKYILLDDEDTNFAFYASNKKKLEKSIVYLKSHSLPAESVCESNLRLFCPEETSTRLFWKQNFLYPVSVQNGYVLDIVFIGFDKLGEELLLFGLQNNIFSAQQKITYHIFGDGTHFQATHTELSSVSDPILFYDKPWYESKELLERAHMVIVLEQNNQTSLLRNLLFTIRKPQIHVFTANPTSANLLAEKERLICFNWKTESQNLDYILNDVLFRRAKRINLRYAHLYSGVSETPEESEKQWALLDTFTRYSNISSADYHEMRLQMLDFDGYSTTDALPDDVLEIYSELEHIRWCRYHYLNNWKHGLPENGKNKDKKLRIHIDLIPYENLTNGEKEKDRENIRILHNIQP